MTEPSNQCFYIIYDLRLLQAEILIINLFQRKRKFLLEECKVELMFSGLKCVVRNVTGSGSSLSDTFY